MIPIVSNMKDRLRPLAHSFRYAVVREGFKVNHLFEKEIQSTRSVPSIMFAFVTNICTARCTFCQYPKHVGKKVVLELQMFKRAIDQFTAKGVKRLSLTPNNGEPLVDKGIFDKIEYARDKGIEHVSFLTNGHLLRRDDIAERLAVDVDQVSISMPGLDRENYRTVFGVDKAEELEEGLIKFAECKKRTKSNIEINLELRIDRPLDVVLKDEGMQRLMPYLNEGTLKITDARSDMFNWSGVVGQDDLTGIMKMRDINNPEKMLPCTRTMSTLNSAILPDGGLRVCYCGRGTSNEGPLVIGNIADTEMEEIILGEKHRRLLRDWMDDKVPDECRQCAVYEPTHYSWGHIFGIAVQLIVSPSWWRRIFTCKKRFLSFFSSRRKYELDGDSDRFSH